MPKREDPRILTGGCPCGKVAYAVPDRFDYALNCHCSQCRKATGSVFKPLAGIAREALTLTRGEDETLRYGGDDGFDVRCRTCGSLLYSVVKDGAYAHVAMGTLVDTPSLRPSAHIFVGSKAPWFEITDDLPQHAELPER